MYKQASATGLSARQPSLPIRGSRTIAQGKNNSEIYIGFPKNDTGSREGRKGRVINDDPKKYPTKEDNGFFIGATGGWAGGEAGLWNLRESIKDELKSGKSAKPVAKKSSGSPKPGTQPIYVGFGKDELDLRKSGEKGRIVYDDASKYPGKEDLGFLAGATGGFAGGERGVKGYVATGSVKLRKAGEPGGEPMSPLVTAFLVLVAGLGSAVLVAQVAPGEGMPSIEGFGLNVAIGTAGLLTVGGALLGSRYLQAQQRSQK